MEESGLALQQISLDFCIRTVKKKNTLFDNAENYNTAYLRILKYVLKLYE